MLSLVFLLILSTLYFFSSTDCPSNYYYNKGIQINEMIDITADCTLRSPLDLIYEKTIYLRNISCLDISLPSACTGKFENPFDDFWKAIKQIYVEDEGQKFKSQKITLVFLGGPHFILQNDFFTSVDSGRLQLFLGFNGSIELTASICDNNIEEKYCLKSNMDLIDIYLKSSDFQFIVSSEFSIKNIQFFANDIILSDMKNNTCLRQSNVCCPALINDCSIENKFLVYSEENLENKSFILIKYYENNGIPKLFLNNTVFFNFYTLQKELGWNTLLLSNTSSKSVYLNNIRILNFYFSHGFWLDFHLLKPEIPSTNNILIANIFFENQSFALIQDEKNADSKIGLITFRNSSNYSINIMNISIKSITNDYYLQNYVFYFESKNGFQKNTVSINNLIFQNSTDIGFLYIIGFFQILLNDFALRNITYSKEIYFFVLLNDSKIIMNNGLIYMIFCSNSFFFSCQKCLQLSLDSVYITNFYGILGNASDSTIAISNSQFESIKSSSLMIISLSDFSIVNSNFSSSIFDQAVFIIFDAHNFIYNESFCINISTAKFVSVLSQSSNYLFQAKIIVYSIRIYNSNGDLIFFNIEDVKLNILNFGVIEIINCSNFVFMQAIVNYLSINVFNISVINLSFSLNLFITIMHFDQLNDEIITVSDINLANFGFKNCVFQESVFLFQVSSDMTLININNFYFDFCNYLVLFQFQLIPNFTKYYKVILNEFTLRNMKGYVENPGLLYLVNSIDFQINCLLITNLDANQCTSLQILNLKIKFNEILLENISISYIKNNLDLMINILHTYEDFNALEYPLNTTLNIQNMKMTSTKISKYVTIVIYFETYNVPITINFNNSYFENVTTRMIWFLSSPLKKLISTYFFNLQFIRVKQMDSDFFLIYSRVPIANVLITNIYIYNSYSFYIILISHMFESIVIKNVTIKGLESVLFCIIFIFQSDSHSPESTKVEVKNIFFASITITNSWLSPMALLYLRYFEKLIFEDIIIRDLSSKNDDSGITYFGIIEELIEVSINKIDFRQNNWIDLDQVFRLNSLYLLEIKNSQFEISESGESIIIRKFQSLYCIGSSTIFFENNTFIGMSTVERPQSKFEEIGVVAIMAEESDDSGESKDFSIVIKNNVFLNNYGIKYGIIGVVGFNMASFINNTFIENEANYGGSVAVISVNLIFLDELTVINSKSRGEGGSIYFIKNDKITFMNSKFDNSFSDSDAGCFYAREIGQILFQNISVFRSSAGFNGGVLYLTQVQNFIINDIVIISSSASKGGVVFVNEKTNLLINNSNFKSGQSKISGGFAFLFGPDTNVTILNCSFFYFTSDQDAAIIASSSILNLTVFSSNFLSSYCENEGLGIIYLEGDSNDEKFVNFFDNFFFNNSALHGANIYYYTNCKLKIINMTSSFNQGSLFDFQSESGGFILISSSIFVHTNHYSSNWSLYSLFISSKCVIVINDIKIISNNGTMHLFELIMETNLIFNNSIITDYFSIKSSKKGNFESNFIIFKVLNSKLISTNSKIVYFSKAFDPSFQSICFDIKESVFTSYNDSYENFSSSEVPYLLNFYKSHIDMQKVSMNIFNFLENIFVIRQTTFIVNNISLSLEPNINNKKIGYFINFDGVEIYSKAIFMKIMNCFFLGLVINIFSVKNLYQIDIVDCNFSALNNNRTNFLGRPVDVRNVLVLLIYSSIFQNYFNDIASCIFISSELNITTVNVSKTIFVNNQAFSSSVLYIRANINLFIDQCFFQENKAINPGFLTKNSGKGGCFIIDCEYFIYCDVFLQNSTFENNFASTIGSTILFKGKKSINFINITFINNIDLLNFTNYFSSTPINNYLLDQTFLKETIELYYKKYSENRKRTSQLLSEYKSLGTFNVASGQPFNFSILIVDSYDQQLISESNIQSILICFPDQKNQSRLIIDRGYASSIKGLFFYEKVSITFKPTSLLPCKITYDYPNNLIFESQINGHLRQSITIDINISLRECIPGELYQVDESCFRCSFGTYALHNPTEIDPSKKCLPCPNIAYCNGGSQLSPLKGYWRINNRSNMIQSCLNAEACLGVGEDVETIKKYKLFDSLTELQKIQGVCRNGYQGNLCYYCQKGLARFKQNAPCKECEMLIIIYLKMAMSIIFIILYVIAQAKTFSNIDKDDPHFALLIKQILNHIQTMSMIDLIDLGWTYEFDFYFSFKDYLSFLSEDFFVIDCMIQEMNGNLLVKKIIFTILLPLILSILMFFVWFAIFFYYSFVKKSTFTQKTYDFFIEKMRITLLIFIFILYPEILKKGFSLLNCIVIDEVTLMEVLRFSPDIECWSGQHLFWVFTVSLPGIIFWGIFSPLFITLVIMINRKNIYQILHNKEYASFNEILKYDKNKKFTILKKTTINIEQGLADKIFSIQKPLLKSHIGYIKKQQAFIESKEILILDKLEFDNKLKFPCLQKELKINFPISGKKEKKNNIIQSDPIIYRNSEKIIKKPEQLFKIIELDIENVNISEDDLNLHRVLVKEEYEIEYDYQKKMKEKKIVPLKSVQLKLPLKVMIVIRNLGFVYRGYKKEYFFWEIVLFSRKFIFIFIGVFTSAFPNQIKPLTFLALLSFYIFLQLSYEPYEFSYLNKLEICSLLTAFCTCLIGLILFSSYFMKYSIGLVLIFFAINLLFLIYWGKTIHRYGKLSEKFKKCLDSIKKILKKRIEKKIRGEFNKKKNDLIL